MAKDRKADSPVPRLIVCAFAWAAWLFLTLSCVSFSPTDPPSPQVYFPQAADAVVKNWCGPVGAKLAYHVFAVIGPGAFVGIVMLGIALVVWTKGDKITQMPLRLIGAALLMAAVSAVVNLFGGDSPRALIEGPGGMMGIALGHFLKQRFNTVGTWLILLPTLLVGSLLAADEIMLALPHYFARGWKKVPAGEIGDGLGSVAGGLMDHVRGWVDSFTTRRSKMGARRKAPSAKGAEDKKGPEIRNPKDKLKEVAEGLAGKVSEERSPANSAEAAKAAEQPKAAAKADEESDDDIPVATRAEPAAIVVRKPTVATMLVAKPQPPAVKQDLGNYKLPGVELLTEPEQTNSEGHEQRVREKAKVLEAALESFNINGKVVAIDTGPVVTLYELELAPGVKSAQVSALSKDIARSLMSPPVRIIDNIPGKNTMGIEVPNLDREVVRLKELFQLGGSVIERMALPMCLGKDASGNPLIEDLAKVPHMLIAGTTGSGKSVCINTIIMSLLLTQRPDHVKMIMVDPKMVEMQDYKSIPHLMAPIIDDMSKAESILEWATQKMDERYETLSEAGVRHIKDYNKLSREEIIERFHPGNQDEEAQLQFHMPYIVIIIDELADLMMTSKEVEGHIVRIAQKARAVGIHLILATQRPEAQVVTGLIKSNMPGRVCFQVKSRLDSRIMLDQSGGELLLGQGDMLMLKPTGGGLMRGQGAYVDDVEIKSICRFLKEIAQPEFHPELMQLGAASGLGEGEEKDPLFNDAVDIMIQSGRGSVSLIQRRLNIGYSRASRIIDQLRRTGIVGAYKGSMASEVTLTVEEWEAMKAAEATGGTMNGIGPKGQPGHVGSGGGIGKSAGFAQQVNSTFDEDAEEEDDGVPDEMSGEHRL